MTYVKLKNQRMYKKVNSLYRDKSNYNKTSWNPKDIYYSSYHQFESVNTGNTLYHKKDPNLKGDVIFKYTADYDRKFVR